MKNEKISNMTGAILCALALLTNAYSVVPGVAAGGAVWVADILATSLALICTAAFCSSCDRFPDETFFGVLKKSFGKTFGIILALVFSIFALLTCAVSLTVFSRFVQITSLPQTPQIIIPLLLIFVSALAVKGQKLRCPSQTAWLLVWFAASVFVFFVFSSLSQIKSNLMTLAKFENFKILPSVGEVFLNRFGLIPAFVAVYTKMSEVKTRRAYMLSSVAVAGTGLAVISAISVITLGEELAKADFYPVYTAMSLRRVGGFVRHTEILASVAMTICLFFKGCICLAFASEMINGVFNTNEKSFSSLPLALITASATQLIYRDISSLRGLLEWKGGAFYFLSFFIALPLALFLATHIKKKVKR